MRLFCESSHTRVLSRDLSRNKKLPSFPFPIYLTYPLFSRKKTTSYRQIMFAYNKKGDYDIPMMSRHHAGHSRHRWGTAASPIRSFTNHAIRALEDGIREPLTIVTSTAVASTPAGVQPAMALHNVRVPPRGNQDGRCTASTTAHDHHLPHGGGPAPDCVQTYPVQGHRPSTTAPPDGQWACCVTRQGWRYASTSNVPVAYVPDTRPSPLGMVCGATHRRDEDGSWWTTRRLTSWLGRGRPPLEMHACQGRTTPQRPRRSAPSAYTAWDIGTSRQ